METLGERLNFVRKKNHYTQESLANEIGVSRGVIYNLEKNITMPQTIVINALCKTLKINKEWLVNGNGEMDDTIEKSQSQKVLRELYDIVKELSINEQLFLLDTVKSLKYRLGDNTENE